MTMLGRIRAISQTMVVAALASLAAGAAAEAQTPGYMQLVAGDTLANRPVYLGINKSVVIDLPQAAGDVLVSNPQIADAVLRTSSRLYLIGVALGQASVFLFDSAGAQIASFDIYVEADLGSLNQLLAEAIPDGYVRAEAIQGSIVLRGQVPSPTDSARAMEIASRLIPVITQSSTASTTAPGGGGTAQTSVYDTTSGGGPGVVNLIAITGEDQVALKVTIAEVQRSITKQLGINVGGSITGEDGSIGTSVAGASGGLSPLVDPGGGELGLSFSHGDFSIQAVLRALDETNMINTLAEPILTAVSGETADFLAGGEFGYPIIQPGSTTTSSVITVAFKPFGVELAFTPVVLSSGRISIRVRTSVSEISGSVAGIPSLTTRRAETTVEQPSGGAFVIGGLLQHNTQRVVSGFPGLQRLPILGSLFSSKKFLDRETELVIIVTPYLVKPVSPNELARPNDNLAPSSDAEAYFLNRLTKVYGHESQVPGRQVGFTFD
jgi:pilus assembly protein CpaC